MAALLHSQLWASWQSLKESQLPGLAIRVEWAWGILQGLCVTTSSSSFFPPLQTHSSLDHNPCWGAWEAALSGWRLELGTPSPGPLATRWAFKGPRRQRVCPYPLGARGSVAPDRANQTVQVYSGSKLRAPLLCHPPPQSREPSLSGSREGVAARQGGWKGWNRYCCYFFSFSWISCQCYVWVELICSLSLSSVHRCLIRLWHIHAAQLFFFGFLFHRGDCRRQRKIPCAEDQSLVQYLCQRKERGNPCGLL